MMSELFDTTVTLIPGKFDTGNRNTQFKYDETAKKEGIPGLVVTDYITYTAYIEKNPDVTVNRGYVLIDESTGNKYTVDKVYYITDAYKLKLSVKEV